MVYDAIDHTHTLCMHSINVFKRDDMCWLQFGLSFNNFQQKRYTGLHKSVKHYKSLVLGGIFLLSGQDLFTQPTTVPHTNSTSN